MIFKTIDTCTGKHFGHCGIHKDLLNMTNLLVAVNGDSLLILPPKGKIRSKLEYMWRKH